MDTSIFTSKAHMPAENDLKQALGTTFPLWVSVVQYVRDKYPAAQEEWNYPGEKYGWSFRMKDKKRAILYLLPRARFFKTAFVFGQKATDAIMNSTVSKEIKTELEAARVYAEGRGIRIDVKNKKGLEDIFRLVDIKLSH